MSKLNWPRVRESSRRAEIYHETSMRMAVGPRIIHPRDFHLHGQVDLSSACLCQDRRRSHTQRCPEVLKKPNTPLTHCPCHGTAAAHAQDWTRGMRVLALA